jgi:hypothetical protein
MVSTMHGRRPFGAIDVDQWHILSESECRHEKPFFRWTYDFEQELVDQRNRLPSFKDAEELCYLLDIPALREMSSEILKRDIVHAKGESTLLEFVRFLNSWIATAEETLAAEEKSSEIAARRKRPQRAS